MGLSVSRAPERRERLQAQGRLILAIDGLQPELGQEVLWVVREVLSGEVLLARSLLCSTAGDRVPLLREATGGLKVPVVGVVSDGERTVRNAVAEVFAGVAHQLCHLHYLPQAAGPMWEADRHAKKELKKRVRGIRPEEVAEVVKSRYQALLERMREQDTTAGTLQGAAEQCLAVTPCGNAELWAL